jgi:hypothetical protein
MTSSQAGPAGGNSARQSIGALVHGGALDAELAGLVELMVGARVPVVVAGPAAPARDRFVEAVIDLLPPDTRIVVLAGEAEDFEWLPEAIELGWRHDHGIVRVSGPAAPERPSPATTVMVARDLGGDGSEAVGGSRARLAVRALALGYGLVAAMSANGLEGVFDRLGDAAIGTDEDERSRVGLVLALEESAAGPRVVAAHYVRPLARDAHGHVQRLPPAVLATWDPEADRWDHFAWGVLPELADRTGRRPVDFEREQARIASGIRRPS